MPLILLPREAPLRPTKEAVDGRNRGRVRAQRHTIRSAGREPVGSASSQLQGQPHTFAWHPFAFGSGNVARAAAPSGRRPRAMGQRARGARDSGSVLPAVSLTGGMQRAPSAHCKAAHG